jgi:aspartyl aminopeptidase
MCSCSFLISADMAHAVHPNFKDKNDASYAPVVNGGPVIKAHAGMKYATTAETAARFAAICADAGVPVQQFIPRSDMPTGSTVGPMVSSRLGIPTVDVGNPIWGMHSCMETAGVHDQALMTKALATFYRQDHLGQDHFGRR